MKIMVTVRAQPEITEFLCPVGHYTVDLMSVLGRGEFGVVLKAFSGSSKPIAAKRYCPKPNDWELLLSAANALKLDNSHENVLLVLDVINTEDSVWIFMELCWGNVEDWFRTRRDSVELDTKLDLMRQITQGVSFLHDRNIIHRDIKPSNVLLHSEVAEPTVKLSDFALSRVLDPVGDIAIMSSDIGALAFKAPEFFQGGRDEIQYSRGVDVFAMGLTFLAMIQAKPGQYRLLPRAETQLDYAERQLAIGQLLLHYVRINNVQAGSSPDVIVVDDPQDTESVNMIKSLVRRTTHVSHQKRPTVEEVQTSLTSITSFAHN